ncbi:hypothetical protein FHS31_003234 [Sphingomonas vulcanisoli]|uniref:Uncharacterized protein n=1 Tax=Sphingomonas vulcanisoli TaxID=1658060 RepID=A0ABX0TYL3_9SPHN|nr:hypothetical protein [Sphingomonas vulcanisoli]NIJ09597.1 hypothetical protein [Sphingomonas vulcanisoli]
MTLETLFLIVIPAYLAIVAYGQVGARRRGLAPKMRAMTGALRVLLPPVAIFVALLSTGDALLIMGWGMVTLGMAVAGAIVAGLVEVVAPKVGA